MKRTQADPIRDELAGELGVAPGQVVRYGRNDGLYVVLLDDFRKVSVPEARTAAADEDDEPQADESGGSGGGEAAEDVAPRLASVLERPHLYDRAVLRRVGERLGIPGAAALNKKPLVRAINGWKRARAQEQRGR